jgi:glucose-6-phosphate 1-dehydrogenase
MAANAHPEHDVQALVLERPLPDHVVLCVFGASGDLAHRKLFPAIGALAAQGRLPKAFTLIGVARTSSNAERFRAECIEAAGSNGEVLAERVHRFEWVTGNFDEATTFDTLAKTIRAAASDLGGDAECVFYLATVPSVFTTAADGLAGAGLNKPGRGIGSTRIVIEKPFGTDLESAELLDADLHKNFAEEQIYRIDHYLGKETVQNLLALRFANAIFEPIWNRRYVDHVQITVAETLGVEHRGTYYERSGALRDIVQNHLLQVLALVVMEPPAVVDAQGVRDEKVKALRSVEILDPEAVAERVVRAQYSAGVIAGEAVPAYRDEDGVSPQSTTETYVAAKLGVDNWRWAGVPFYVRTGKRLQARATEVAMVFQRVPHLPFTAPLSRELGPNVLVMRIQPDEGISIRFGAKVPGPALRVRTVTMHFDYLSGFGGVGADAYERLLVDAMAGDPTLFIRSDEVRQAWRIVTPILEAWQDRSSPLSRYEAGTWGPREANRLIEVDGRSWIEPIAGPVTAASPQDPAAS